MHGHVVALRDDASRRVEDGARVVAPLLDVGECAVRRSVMPISSATEV
jgi:hypothetical protein